MDISKKLTYKPMLHLLNSAGITNYPEYQFDMVRIGIGMVGISSNKFLEKRLMHAVEFKTVISQISEVKKEKALAIIENILQKKIR